jgi:hypothetical protein
MVSTRVADIVRDAVGSIYLWLPWRLQRLMPRLRIGRGRWRIVPVADLPYPHDLFKCSWRDLHRAAIAAEADSPGGRRRAFEAFLADVGSTRITRCPYHELNWAVAADFVCDQFNSRVYDRERIITAARAVGVDESAIEGICEFFREPVWISGDGLGNGQHRSCAMRVAGGKSCPIER